MSRRSFVIWLVLFALIFVVKLAIAEPYKAEPGPHPVDAFLVDLRDDARDRAVPLKVYRPRDADAPLPVVLLSHGLGGTREGLRYLAQHWASHGYACVVMQHLGSDDSVWRDAPLSQRKTAMARATKDPRNALNRAHDVTFVLDTLAQAHGQPAQPHTLHGHYNLDQIAIAGHSFGAWTCLAAAGLEMPVGPSHADPRIKSILPLSSPAVAQPHRDQAYRSIRVPSLHLTGTLDDNPIGNGTAQDRRVPYDHTPGPGTGGAPKYLVTFNGADHMTFSGEINRRRPTNVSAEDNRAFHAIIQQSTTAFLDATLLADPEAQAWLNQGRFNALVGPRGKVEMDTTHRPTPPPK